jgi:transcription elongation factor Elf1
VGPAGEWLTYRCPVCNHTDGVSLAGTVSVLIRCSHCDTPLEVRPRGLDSAYVTVAFPQNRRRASQKERA